MKSRGFINSEFGLEYLPDHPNFYKNKKSVQDAHEAIRPTSVMRNPESVKHHLGRDEFRLYSLIWQRFVASQMKPALFDETIITVECRAL